MFRRSDLSVLISAKSSGSAGWMFFSVRQRIPLVSLPFTHLGNNWVLWNSSLFKLLLSIHFFFVVVDFNSNDYCETFAKCWAHGRYMFSLFRSQILNQQTFVNWVSTVNLFTFIEMVNNVIKPLIKHIQPVLFECHNFNTKVISKGFLIVATHIDFSKDVLQTSRWWCWFNIIIFLQMCNELFLYVEGISTYSDAKAIRLHKTTSHLNAVVFIFMILSFIH